MLVTARTAAGDIPIGGIQFNVPSTFTGINGFNHVATIPAIPSVVGSGTNANGAFLRITLSLLLSSPAPLVLHTNLVSFAVDYRGVFVGRAKVDPLDLYRGVNTLSVELDYQPLDPSDSVASDLLTQYVEVKTEIGVNVRGDLASSPYGVLQEALSQVTLVTAFPGQGTPLIANM